MKAVIIVLGILAVVVGWRGYEWMNYPWGKHGPMSNPVEAGDGKWIVCVVAPPRPPLWRYLLGIGTDNEGGIHER